MLNATGMEVHDEKQTKNNILFVSWFPSIGYASDSLNLPSETIIIVIIISVFHLFGLLPSSTLSLTISIFDIFSQKKNQNKDIR